MKEAEDAQREARKEKEEKKMEILREKEMEKDREFELKEQLRLEKESRLAKEYNSWKDPYSDTDYVLPESLANSLNDQISSRRVRPVNHIALTTCRSFQYKALPKTVMFLWSYACDFSSN
jgi:hypothetical protein